MRWSGGARRQGVRGPARVLHGFLVLGVALLLAACGGSPAAPVPAASNSGAQSPASGAAPAAAPAAAPLVPMQVGYGAITASYMPLYVAAEMKAWEKYGLDVELVHLPGNTGPQSLLAGQVPLVALSGFASAPSMIEGADFVIFATMIPRHTARIYGGYGIDTPQALRGKRLGVTRLGTLTHFGALLALREWGLEPDKDVALVSLNESANIYAGMIGGAVDAGVLNDPYSFAAQKAGYPLLVDLVDWPVDSNSAGFTTTRSFLQQNRPMLVSFLRGYMEGHKRFFEDRAYAIDALRKYAKIEDPEVLENTYALYVERYFVKVPMPTVAGLQNIIDDYAEVNPRAKGIDATPMVDPSLVQDLQREGFFRQLGLE